MLKRIPLIALFSLGFIFVGGSFYAGAWIWQATRIWVPVSVPISLSHGLTRTENFKLNLDSSYTLYIGVDEGSDRQEAICLMGIEQCQDKPSILRAHWTLFDSEKAIANGTTDRDQEGIVTWKVFRELGTFKANKGKRYSLDVDILDDASHLNSLNPRLIVQENGQHWLYGPLGNVFWDIATLFILFGLLLLGRWIFTKIRARRSPMWLSFTSPGQAERLSSQRTPLRISDKPYATSTKLKACLGIFMMVMGIATFERTCHWFATRTFVAIDMPLSLTPGHIRTGPFSINLRDLYEVAIKTEDSSLVSYSCYSGVKTNWTLYSNGKVKENQNGDQTYLGQFTSERTTYDLELNLLSNASCLNPTHPRLQIYTDKSAYVENVNIVLAISLLTSIAGLGLIILWLLPIESLARGKQLQLTDTLSLGQYIPFAQTLPLQRKFEGFRSFGLVGAITMVVVLFPVWVVTQWHEVSVGLPVSLLRRGATLKRIDPWTEPIILQVIDIGAGKPPKIELNSKLFSWDDLQPKLKQEIARRPPGAVVYIVGDENLPWADVVYAIDTARGLQAKVVLLGKEIQ